MFTSWSSYKSTTPRRQESGGAARTYQLTKFVTTRISGVKAKTSKSTLGWKSFLRVGRQDGKPDPPSLEHIVPLPNVDRYGLEQKYGKFGKVVGDGAGGSVQLVTRPSNNVTYAVKKFKAKNAGEDEREYVRKIIAEFRIGSQLRHGNIIETLELFEEHKQWYQVMEYAPYCLLASALSREMSTEEIKCSFLQTLAGVDHLHRSGLAHRDLKLENVVVTEGGIMKIIDFGSAAICRHPRAKNVTLATGIVGCFPYMAPEILQDKYYDPQRADIWSLAIMYCCMVLGRFPWKVAASSDEAFSLFTTSQKISISLDGDAHKKELEHVLGPWRLLRLLPSESRAVIEGMLDVNANSRPTLQQISDNAWVKQSQLCSQDDSGTVQCGYGHEHTLRYGQFVISGL